MNLDEIKSYSSGLKLISKTVFCVPQSETMEM